MSFGNKRIMGDNIQRYLSLNGLDRRELAKKIDVSYTSVTEWINAKSYPRIDKIEKMATDKDYREKYESVISGASSQLSKMKDQLMASGADFKGFGMQVNDGGTASFFAVVGKSQEAQAKRIEAKRAETKAAHFPVCYDVGRIPKEAHT